MDHQINADTLRKYLPAEENQQGIVLRDPVRQTGKDYSHEIGILYNMVIQNKKDIEEVKALLTKGERLAVSGLKDDAAHAPTITIAQPTETAARKHVDAEAAEEVEANLRIEDAEIDRIKRALEVSGGNRKVAADRLDISERTLYRKIKEYRL